MYKTSTFFLLQLMSWQSHGVIVLGCDYSVNKYSLDFHFSPQTCILPWLSYNKAFILLAERRSWRVPLSDWLNLGVKVKSSTNADVDFCNEMASLTAVMQTSRSSSSSKKTTEMTTRRRFKLLDTNIVLFLSLASMLHCALADGKTLVLLDNLNIRDTHSIFFRSLAGDCDIHTISIHKYSYL